MTIPKKSEIFLHWKQWLHDNGFDWGEPSCWACGKWWVTKYDITNPHVSDEELAKNYDRVKPLQRCHIVPRSLGGSDDVSNLFLMCKECHDLAPNTLSKDVFFQWVEHQSWFSRKYSEHISEMKTFGISEKDCKAITKLLFSKDFNQWCRKNIGLHWSQSGYGAKITTSSLYAAVQTYRKIKNRDFTPKTN